MSPWKILSYTEVYSGMIPNIDQIEVSFRQYSVLSFYSSLRSNNEKVSVEKIRTFYFRTFMPNKCLVLSLVAQLQIG